MKRKEIAPPPDPRKTASITLPDGRLLQLGDEFTVRSYGRYAFRYGWQPQGELAVTQVTCWGPVGSSRQSWRTFYVGHITRVHRKPITRKADAQ